MVVLIEECFFFKTEVVDGRVSAPDNALSQIIIDLQPPTNDENLALSFPTCRQRSGGHFSSGGIFKCRGVIASVVLAC